MGNSKNAEAMDMNDNNLYISVFHAPADSLFSAVASWDCYKVHKLLSAGFDAMEELKAARLLFRFDFSGSHGFLCVQSKLRPDWSCLDGHYAAFYGTTNYPREHTIIGPKLLTRPPLEIGNRLRFRLLARPTMRVGAKDDPEKGKRVSIDFEEDQRDWLDKKGTINGFEIEQCSISDRIWHDSKNEETHRGAPKTIKGVQFDGVLKVTDSEQFYDAIANGIGTQKAFGFGLMSVAKITPA